MTYKYWKAALDDCTEDIKGGFDGLISLVKKIDDIEDEYFDKEEAEALMVVKCSKMESYLKSLLKDL